MNTSIENRVKSIRDYYNTGATKPIEFRIEQLKRLKYSVIRNTPEIEAALWQDLRKSSAEAYLTEISILTQEIDLHISKLHKWAKKEKRKSPLHLFPSRSYLIKEPLGVALIIAPWNYPFQLILNPLVGSISAGCATMLKTSPSAPATAQIVEKIIRECFEPSYVDITHGGRETNTPLLEQRWDKIFFTGSPQFGKIVYSAAAQHLTPVTLELGGKSPAIVEADANIEIAARRIAWGKCINAGQTCVAPDYLFIHSSVKEQFLLAYTKECEKMYGGSDFSKSEHYPRLINEAAFDRLVSLIEGEKIYYGGLHNRADKFLSPTLLTGITPDSPIMQEEIFGPILPVMTFDELEEVIEYINSHEKPLALYYFGKNEEKVLGSTSSGGACVNDTIMHVSNHHIPFGGVGNSGLGSYHGKDSFLIFSHCRAVVKTPTCIDLPMKYPPFRFINLIKRFL